MSRNRFPREFYIPKGSIKIGDKQSSAVVFVKALESGGHQAVAFHGNAQKPDWNYLFRKPGNLEKNIARHFESIRAHEARIAKEAAERKAHAHKVEVGDVFKTCWGYDQTNVEFFECVEVRGKAVILRELARETAHDGEGHMSGRCVPLVGQYVGEPIRRFPSVYGSIRIDDVRRASPHKAESVAGVKVFQPASYSWGH